MATNTYKTVKGVLAAAVANNGTFTFAYPSGSVQGDFTGNNANATDEVVIINDSNRYGASLVDISYGASLVTVTNQSGESWPAGASYIIQLSGANRPVTRGVKAAAIVDTAAATGTASDTIPDMTGSYSQSLVNNALKTLATKQNTILAALRTAGIIS